MMFFAATAVSDLPVPPPPAPITRSAPTWMDSTTSPTITQPTTTPTTVTPPTITMPIRSTPGMSTPHPSPTIPMCSLVEAGDPSTVITCTDQKGFPMTALRADLLPKDPGYEAGLRSQLCAVKPWECE